MTLAPGTLAPSRTELLARSRDGRARGDSAHESLEAPPVRAAGLELLGPVAGSGYRNPPALVRRADGQTIQVTPLLYEILVALDGRRGFGEIAAAVSERISRQATADDVRFLIDNKLRPLGVLRETNGAEPAVKKLNPLLGLRLRKVVTNRNVTRRITAPFAKLFSPVVMVPTLATFGLATAWVLFEKGLASATHQAFYEPGMLLLVFALTMLSAGFHEVGHAAASTYGGAAPGAMGVALYLVWPAFYTDVTDSYRLGRGGRLRVDLGGLYFNAIFAVAMLGLWAATGWDALLLLVPAQLLHMLHQLLPFVRFDGYHILADVVGVPDLFAHIKPTLRHMLPWHWGKREAKVLKPWARAVVTLWVLAVVPVLGFALVMMVKALPRVAATAGDSIAERWDLLQTNLADGASAEVAVGLLSILTVGLPVLGISYLLFRVVRRTSLRVWRATAGRPVMRALSVLAGAAMVALLAWTWWPDGQYRPIQPNEGGTLINQAAPVPSAPASVEQPRISLPGTYSTSASDTALRPQLVMVLSPEGVPITDPGPKRIVPLPRSGARDTGTLSFEPSTVPEDLQGEWDFPFNPPDPPTDGDNQALAVNTQDGSTVYDVAFAVLWVSDDDVDQINEAWAVASCMDCKTVAVAFQGIFVLGESDVIIPQNRAVAVNHDCARCETTAISIQFVASLTRPPSEAAMDELSDLWEDLDELEGNVDELPLDEVYTEMKRIEAEVFEILIDDGALVLPGDGEGAPTSEPAPTPSDSTGGTTTTTDGEEPAVTATPTPAEEPTATPTSEPTSTPTEEPSPEPSSEPEPTPEESPSSEPTPESSPEP